MVATFACAALFARLMLDHRVELTPEWAVLRQGDPLLLRVRVRHGAAIRTGEENEVALS